MSIRNNVVLGITSAWRDRLSRSKFRRDGQPLSARDTRTWVEAVILTAHVWYDSLDLLSYSKLEVWVSSAHTYDVLEVCRVLKDADSILIQDYESESFLTLNEFKTSLYTQHSQAGEILSPLWETLALYFKDPTVGLLRSLHQCLAFISHLNLRDYEDPDLVKAWFMDDARLPSPDPDVAHRLNIVLRRWLAGFKVITRPENPGDPAHLPRHGNGSVAESKETKALARKVGISPFSKYAWLGMDLILAQVIRRHTDSSPEELLPPCVKHMKGTVTRTSYLQDVPKSALTRRLICMEPSVMMYFQQMVFSALKDYFRRDRRIRQIITLEDQTFNQRMALEGSISGGFATIDLSKASDSVSWDLARAAFKGTPLLPWLYATRSRYVKTSGYAPVKVKKFAAMGSALTFPVECLIFAATCEISCEEVGKTTGRRHFEYHVYGDDIAISTEVTEVLVRNLTLAGFTVNRDKSFSSARVGTFRESCGKEYVNGIDVTAIRIPRRFRGDRPSLDQADVVEDLIDLANAFYRRGLLNARRCIIHRLWELPVSFRPAFGDSRFGLAGDPDWNYTSFLVAKHHRYLVFRNGKEKVLPSNEYQRKGVIAGRGSMYKDCASATGDFLDSLDPEYEPTRLYQWFLQACSSPNRLKWWTMFDPPENRWDVPTPCISDISRPGKAVLERTAVWL